MSSLRRDAAHGIENAIGRVNTVKIFRNFAAQKSARDGMFGIALNFRCAAIFDGDEHGAAVRTIMRTRCVNNSLHGRNSIIPREQLRATDNSRRLGALPSPSLHRLM